MPARSVIIKKYENRRLYDSTNSRYVNLEEIAQMVRDGIDVQVVDAASGEDLTRMVLTQIIAENAKGSGFGFSSGYAAADGDCVRPRGPGRGAWLHEGDVGSVSEYLPGLRSRTGAL